MENMMGRDKFSRSFPVEAVSILFVLGDCIIFLPFKKSTKKEWVLPPLTQIRRTHAPCNNNRIFNYILTADEIWLKYKYQLLDSSKIYCLLLIVLILAKKSIV